MKYQLLLFLLCINFTAFSTDVTFSVDVSNESLDGKDVYIAGGFSGWGLQQMTANESNTNIYEITIDVAEGNHDYKFVIGNWELEEDMTGNGCSDNNNRKLSINSTDAVILPTETFNICSTPKYVKVTFSVDMSNETVGDDGVFMTGLYGSWNHNDLELVDDDNDQIYTREQYLEIGSEHSYNFINGNWEDARENCSEGKNRKLKIYNDDISVPTATFGACDDQVMVTFSVDMSEEEVGDDGVYMTGLNNSWNHNEIKLYDLDEDNVWETQVALDKNSTHSYNFINGNWEDARDICPEGKNRTVEVLEDHLVVPTVAFGKCNEELVYISTTFQVDMSSEELVDEKVFIVELNGKWEPKDWIEMSDENEDGIYTATVNLLPGDQFYRFNNGSNWNDEDLSGEECAGEGVKNRYVEIVNDGSETPTMTIPIVAFNSCTSTPKEKVQKEVTFKVDASEFEDLSKGMYIAASWNSWEPENFTMMSDEDEDGIWEVTVTLEGNTTHEYKFTLGDDWSDIEDMLKSGCEKEGTNNRYITLDETEDAVILDAVRYNSCTSEVPEWIKVSFMVDVSDLEAKEAVSLQGEWSNDAIIMNDLGNNIFSKAVYLRANAIYEYSFMANEEGEDFEGECLSESKKRTVAVMEEELTLTTVIFNSCDESENEPSVNTVQVTFSVNLSKEKPSDEGVFIAGSWPSNDWDPNSFDAMSDEDGDGIWEVTLELLQGMTYEYQFTIGQNWENTEDMTDTGCEVEDTKNRSITVETSDIVLPTVCFNACSECYFPVVSITVSGDDITEKGGTSQMIASIFPINADVQTVTWSVDNTDIATIDANGLVTAITDGQVIVTATSTEDGSTVKGTKEINISGYTINSLESELEAAIKVYPNPATERIHIASEQNVLGINILDAQGKLIQEVNLGNASINNTEVNIQSLSKGLYIIKIIGEGWNKSSKVLLK
ncbi:carbohydrate-binding module family 20 domain-containing protein [Flammeovirga agarivorans]|uniref:T9SS type A sorting domain-containing protein n=1 Tax=Flammeovirga agarivorans TaxID=2726742 RepID=A0A7X8SKX1_9BACT|nr:carbohydrate-binding module family 20 domain-containing protein [Flammeovirga agarivorans]NLR92035.1 T9SS type A sorting domain-containing protein [Flammeovirga agarivorans]